MKKTVSINLNGLIFNIDEDAFMVLSDYLEKLKAYFSKKEEGEEIMSDIELRIAEIFTSKISPSKLVINISDVEEVMNTMGRVEEICDGDSSTDTGSRAGEKKNQKKFFRDTDNRLLGGVCAGLSHYSGINLLAIRILFVVFFLFSAGFVTLVYFILWLIVPKAVTVADRLEMKGKDINISNIENTIKEEYKEVKENFRKMKNSKNFQDNLNRSGRVMAGSLNIIFGIFGKVLGALFIIIGVFFIFVLGLGLFASSSEFFINEIAGLEIVPLPYILSLFTNPTISWLFVVALSLVCFIPLIAMVYAGINIVLKLKSVKILNLSMFILWLVGLSMLIALSISMSSHFVSSNDVVLKNIVIADSAKTIHVNTLSNMGEDDFMEHVFIENLRLVKVNNAVKAAGQVEVSVHASTDSIAYFEVQKCSRGENRSQAGKNASMIRYRFAVQDSLITLDEYFFLPDGFKLRGQEVEIGICIPVGTKLVLDKNTMPLIEDTESVGNIDFDELQSGTFLMTPQGLILVAE